MKNIETDCLAVFVPSTKIVLVKCAYICKYWTGWYHFAYITILLLVIPNGSKQKILLKFKGLIVAQCALLWPPNKVLYHLSTNHGVRVWLTVMPACIVCTVVSWNLLHGLLSSRIFTGSCQMWKLVGWPC